MQCTMISPGLPRVRIAADQAPASGPSPAAACRLDQPCRQAWDAGDCPAARAASPVLDAFSAIISHEPVLLVIESDHGPYSLEETGQRAALRLLLAALRASGCSVFGELLPAGIGRPEGGDCRAAFRRSVRDCLGRQAKDGKGSAPHRLAEAVEAVEARLALLLDEARRRCRQDAAPNAVVILFNCVQLAVAEAEDGQTVRPGPDAVRVARTGRRKTDPAAGLLPALVA